MKYQILKTSYFNSWTEDLAQKIRVRILARLDLISIGHFGDYKRFEELIEFRWKNGIRIYCFQLDNTTIVCLIGGNKNGQSKDIKKAKKIRKEVVNATQIFH